MGNITYSGAVVSFDDRLLAHLQIVIVQKFRRQEVFVMSWLDSITAGNGRSSVWMSPTIPIYFKFAGSRVPEISQSWLDRLSESASSSQGLVVVYEDGSLARAEGLKRR